MQNEDNNRDEGFVNKIFTWILAGWFLVPFKIIAFIFWRNKYAKQYWEKRRTWREKMRKLRVKAMKDIVLSTMIPKLEDLGFRPVPNSIWGWSSSLRVYEYEVVKIEGNEIRYFTITFDSRDETIRMISQLILLKTDLLDTIPDLWEYSEYIDVLDEKVESYFPCNGYHYQIKNFKNKEQLQDKSIPDIKRKIEQDFSDIETFNKKFFGKRYDKSKALDPKQVEKIREENARTLEEDLKVVAALRHKDNLERKERKKREEQDRKRREAQQ